MSPEIENPALLQKGVAVFARHFDEAPTVAASAPGRVNLIGEHTDYNDGFVLPLALDRRTVMLTRPNHSSRCRVVAADLDEQMATFLIDRPLDPGRTMWKNYVLGVVNQFIANGHRIPGFDAVVVSDVPIGSGLSSSAALEVATATVLEGLMGIRLPQVTKAIWCQKAEHEFAGMPCGIMDQFISVMGRSGHLLLIDCRSQEAKPVALGGDEENSVRVVIANSNVSHELSGSEYAVRRQQCQQAVQTLATRFPHIKALRDAEENDLEEMRLEFDPVIFKRARHVILENARTLKTAEALAAGDWRKAGIYMSQSHRSLRDDYEVSCAELDLLVELAGQVDGVYGARMTGGGFGGCIVCLADADAVDRLSAHLEKNYPAQAGRETTIFVTTPSDGARLFDPTLIS